MPINAPKLYPTDLTSAPASLCQPSPQSSSFQISYQDLIGAQIGGWKSLKWRHQSVRTVLLFNEEEGPQGDPQRGGGAEW